MQKSPAARTMARDFLLFLSSFAAFSIEFVEPASRTKKQTAGKENTITNLRPINTEQAPINQNNSGKTKKCVGNTIQDEGHPFKATNYLHHQVFSTSYIVPFRSVFLTTILPSFITITRSILPAIAVSTSKENRCPRAIFFRRNLTSLYPFQQSPRKSTIDSSFSLCIFVIFRDKLLKRKHTAKEDSHGYIQEKL